MESAAVAPGRDLAPDIRLTDRLDQCIDVGIGEVVIVVDGHVVTDTGDTHQPAHIGQRVIIVEVEMASDGMQTAEAI